MTPNPNRTESKPATLHVAILGAGFSGTMVAVHLLRMARDAHQDVRVQLIDPAPIARGRAYAATSPEHRLNVPAVAMSAFPDDPDHFARWAHARGAAANGAEFLSRGLYGDYLTEIVA